MKTQTPYPIMRTTTAPSATRHDSHVVKSPVAASPTSVFSDFAVRRFSAACSQRLTELKERVAASLAGEFSALDSRWIRQVVNEADSLAATTPFPALLLPVLAEEKARSAAER